MSDLSLTERLKIRSLSAERMRRRAVTLTLSSPLLRWRFAGASPDQILIVPQELRTSDPSFWNEVEHGHFGLACEIADLKGASPFRATPPSLAWERELHGFGWLRHLAATEEDAAAEAARQFVLDWIALHRTARGVPYEPAVIARRLLSWISHANLLLEGIDARGYSAIMSSLGQQIIALKTTWRNAPDGVPRMVCLIALVLADLAVSGHDRQLVEAQEHLISEIKRQILEDGGHVSRNANTLADLVLDLLPLGQCFQARGRQAPDEIGAAVRKALAFLRFMRMGDGMLARFNGVSTGSPAALATVLGYSDGHLEATTSAQVSGYARLERGDTILIADVGSPPPLAMASEAQAGALSFEMTTRNRLLFVNCGFPGPADQDWSAVARATASHTTLTLSESSSSRLVRHPELEEMVSGPPIRGPDLVASKLGLEGNSIVLAASHDGYVKRFGLMHARRLAVSGDGKVVEGVDRLEPPRGQLRLKHDLPYAIRFHLHPDCKVSVVAGDASMCRITLGDGRLWAFSADGGELSLEESLYFVDSAGPRPTLQIVLRGTTFGETQLRWRLAATPETVDTSEPTA